MNIKNNNFNKTEKDFIFTYDSTKAKLLSAINIIFFSICLFVTVFPTTGSLCEIV